MTTMTTVLGLLPLVLFPGAGSELYRGLGSVVLGGLLVSTVFTLVLVPTLFSLTLDAKEFVMNRAWRAENDDAQGCMRVNDAIHVLIRPIWPTPPSGAAQPSPSPPPFSRREKVPAGRMRATSDQAEHAAAAAVRRRPRGMRIEN